MFFQAPCRTASPIIILIVIPAVRPIGRDLMEFHLNGTITMADQVVVGMVVVTYIIMEVMEDVGVMVTVSYFMNNNHTH